MNKDEFFKFFKNKNNRLICIILIIGVVLMAAAGGHKGESTESVPEVSTADEEERLAEILSQIDGAGSVSVMITYYSSSQKDIAYETKTASREDKSESEDKKAVMSDGEPMVIKEVYPKVKGVIVTAQGAGETAVRSEIFEAVAAALDVPAHRICIFKKEE
jgi:stage III sporulation protein AG